MEGEERSGGGGVELESQGVDSSSMGGRSERRFSVRQSSWLQLEDPDQDGGSPSTKIEREEKGRQESLRGTTSTEREKESEVFFSF